MLSECCCWCVVVVHGVVFVSGITPPTPSNTNNSCTSTNNNNNQHQHLSACRPTFGSDILVVLLLSLSEWRCRCGVFVGGVVVVGGITPPATNNTTNNCTRTNTSIQHQLPQACMNTCTATTTTTMPIMRRGVPANSRDVPANSGGCAR